MSPLVIKHPYCYQMITQTHRSGDRRDSQKSDSENFKVPLNNLNNINFGHISFSPLQAYARRLRGEGRGPIRVLVPPPPMKAAHLWSTATERDEWVGTKSLPGSPSRGAALAAAHHGEPPPPKGESQVKPGASKPACFPGLRKRGRVDCRGACGVVDDDDEGSGDDEEEGLIPP